MKKELELDSCTKEKCSACDIGYLIKDFVKPIMQALTIDVKDYYMRLLTTKCLNLAVCISFFMAGPKKGIAIADYCDSNLTTKRHESGEINNITLMDAMQKDILNKNVKYRYLYYILMTDSYLPTDDSNEPSKFFCGHVMIIEKIPNGKDPYYYFYQAYINEYDFKGHVKKNKNTLKIPYNKMVDMLKKMKYILLNKYWDETSIKYWKDITFVDSSALLGSKPTNKIYLCYKKAKLNKCVEHLLKYTNQKLKDTTKYKAEDMNKIYGDPSLFDSDQNPLTVYDMKRSFEKLQNRIIEHKMNLNNQAL